MYKPFLISIFLVLFSFEAFSQNPENPKVPKTAKEIKSFISRLCWNVGQAILNTDKSSSFYYDYQKQIYEVAGVDTTNNEQEANRKIRVWWKDWGHTCKCNSISFDVVDGSVLKYAASRTTTDFIMDAISWKIDLNDTSDIIDNNRTLLDYVQAQLIQSKGGPLEAKYKQYFDVLREHGAKFKSEL
jgi:hypothetical protein